MFEKSFWTVWSVTELGDEGLCVINVKCIQSVVAVVPHDHHILADQSDERYFIWEYLGLEMDLLSDALTMNVLDGEDIDDE